MQGSKFFLYVWRINGLILLTAGLMAIAILAFAGYKLYADAIQDRVTHSIVNIQEETDITEQWQWGPMSNIQGTPYVMLPLNSGQRYVQSYYNKSVFSARNYLFINSETQASHWLLDHNNALIDEYKQLSEVRRDSDQRPIQAILYYVVQVDTDQDNRLTNHDQKTLAFSYADGHGYKALIQNVETVVGQHMVDESRLLLVYRKQGATYSAMISLRDLTIIKQQPLPEVSP